MENRSTNLKLAEAFAEKAKSDLHSARSLLKSGDYADSAYHSQQCAEKIVKAVLILSNKFVRTHIVSALFREVIENLETKYKNELKELIPKIEELEEHGVLSRYPEPRGEEVWDPTKEYTAETAADAMEKSELVFRTVSNFLREEYTINV